MTEWVYDVLNWELNKSVQLVPPVPAKQKASHVTPAVETTPTIKKHQSNAPIVGEPLQMDHEHTRQFPEVKFLRGLHKVLALGAVPGVFLT